MSPIVRLLVLACLAGIVVSLGSALVALSRGTPEGSAKLVRALTVRIGLSVLLFAMLMLAWYLGLIAPHGLGGGAPR